MDVISKVRELSKYLDDEAIASALKIPVETVRDILDGKAVVEQVQTTEQSGTVIHVNSVKTAYRQKIISVLRAKGGVGCSVIALGLAYLLSKEIKVLLIDLNLSEGGGDLTYYLNLPEYPHMGLFSDDLETCVVNVEPNFYVLQAPRNVSGEKEKVGQIINLARQDYDAVVIDLPNRNEEEFVNEAMRQSNTLVAVTGGMKLELLRLGVVLNDYQRKDIIIAANRCVLPGDAEELFEGRKIITIEHDGSLRKVFERCDLPGEKSVFMRGVSKIRDVLFDREQKGILRRLIGGF